jgi:ADP-ribose pyrophosphatase YjhB (NUDIX family)
MDKQTEIIIASGPVIIENGKVLLNREKKDYGITNWLFPGGKQKDEDETLEATCKREVMEEMGLEIEIMKQLKTVELDFRGKHYIMYHFLARRIGEVAPNADIVDWGWHDINNLPNNCGPNIYEVIDDYKKSL